MINIDFSPFDVAILEDHGKQIDMGLQEPTHGAFRAKSGNLLTDGRWEWPASEEDLKEAFPLNA